jgi:catechol 2,3-dioxygenase-like lactoylglutathione lyase family enzyme
LLGRFLEFSLTAPDIQASLDFYCKLGFSEAQVGETWAHPYAVVTDGRICLGLHQQEETEPTLTFVKPGLLKHLEVFESRGIEFEYRRLGNDVFNEVAWKDPDGHLLRLIEARTFSPSKRSGTLTSRCGYFTELALPCADAATGKTFWENLGFVAMEEFDDRLPHVSCTSDFIDLGLYPPSGPPRSAGLRFEVDDIDTTLKSLADLGISPRRDAAARASRSALLTAPEGTPLLLVAAN